MGTLSRSQDGRTGANSNAVQVELQADCYAGVWAHHATTTPDESTGRPLITSLTRRRTSGTGWTRRRRWATTGSRRSSRAGSRPESWTHGSAAQRQQWFTSGYRTGDMADCNTFR